MGQRSKAIRKQQRQGKARRRSNMRYQQASTSNMQTDNEHTANQTTQDSAWHAECSILEQVIADFLSVATPFSHYNGRCPRWLQSRVRKDDWSYKPGRSPRRRIRKASNKPQVSKKATKRPLKRRIVATAQPRRLTM